jgi:hypothetical protein
MNMGIDIDTHGNSNTAHQYLYRSIWSCLSAIVLGCKKRWMHKQIATNMVNTNSSNKTDLTLKEREVE